MQPQNAHFFPLRHPELVLAVAPILYDVWSIANIVATNYTAEKQDTAQKQEKRFIASSKSLVHVSQPLSL